ncbi:uncharacterized protein PV06_01955 [Exophiala oligosperma]|uniref:C2H2-type domain-containing protein n=1 Tax=Exophiala oligosperma TaxID=215243 RepID=A0A0D2EEB8_9EURO|nr:uncharacterized protein PV06_01955 [Exophiala oligosperma]KIW46274.1 hypothetical protein PV06_01955 [Exophiala oligosperma]
MGRKSHGLGRKCAFCDRRFTRNEHLQRHQRHHTGEKPFECHLCHKAYARSDVLARHVRNHSLEDKGDNDETDDRDTSTLATTERSTEQQVLFSNYRQTIPTSEQPSVPSLADEHAAGMSSTVLDSNPNVAAQGVDTSMMASMQQFSEPVLTTSSFDQSQMTAGAGFDLTMPPYEYNVNFPSVYEALDVWFAPFGSADHNMLPFSPGGRTTVDLTTTYDSNSLQLSKRVQQAWPRRRASPVIRVIRTMWRCASEHQADNFFSLATATTPLESSSMCRDRSESRWNMDDECRARLISDCETNFLPAESYTGGVTAPGSPHISEPLQNEEVELDGLSPEVPRLNFPSTETLDMSIDFYFRRFHPVLPFIHAATFDAKSTPSSLLLPMCLIGLSTLNPTGAENFIRQYLGKLIRFCRLNLTYKGLGKGGAQQLLTSLTSSLLVLFLGLSCERLVDEHQAHMLAIQTLFIADRHGMFTAQDGELVTDEMFRVQATPDEEWKAWARIESVKRLIVCLISIDSAYTRMLDLAANIGIDRIEVVLPCDSALFDAPSASVFFQRVAAGASMLGEQADLGVATKRAKKPLSIQLDSLGLRTLLDVLVLREAAYRHRLLSKTPSALKNTSFVPAVTYAQNEQAASIARDLVSAAQINGALLYQDASTAILWNHLCMLLCADIDRVQTACGRMGLEAALKAQNDLASWSQTASARRAIIHSAQIFNVLSQHRVSDVKTLLPELILSNAALVMAMYVCANQMTLTASNEPLELLLRPDWPSVGAEGLSTPLHGTAAASSSSNTILTKRFIAEGGPFTFGGEDYIPGPMSARRVVLTYAQLVDEISQRGESEHSRLLRTISDFLGGVSI